MTVYLLQWHYNDKKYGNNYPVPVDPDPADDIEHIDDLRDPREDGDEGGVWKLNAGWPPFSPVAQLFMSFMT